MSDEALVLAIRDSRQQCDCSDCDGFWCVWCLTHHGKKVCPFVVEMARG